MEWKFTQALSDALVEFARDASTSTLKLHRGHRVSLIDLKIQNISSNGESEGPPEVDIFRISLRRNFVPAIRRFVGISFRLEGGVEAH